MAATHKTVAAVGSTGANVTLTPQQVQAVEAEWAANPPPSPQQMLEQLRQKAVGLLADQQERNALLFRGVVLTLIDELNLHAAKINSILTAIDSGSTLAQVKANVLAIADYPARTPAQVRATINAKLTAGNADI